MQELIIELPVDYGYAELKKSRKKYTSLAMMLAFFLVSVGIGSYWLTVYLTRDEEPKAIVRMLKYSELGPPPSLTNEAAPAVAVSGPAVKPTVGIPVPVPDAEVSPDQTIASQKDLSQQSAPLTDAGGQAGQILKDIDVDKNMEKDLNLQDAAPPDFVAYEKEPVPVKRPEPKYPDIAVKAQIEGTVFLKLWVTKEGKVKKAVVVKSDADVLNDAAITAAKQWVFTPALQQKKPIDVWVVVPFRFRLKDAGN